jgi:hypothetical protein
MTTASSKLRLKRSRRRAPPAEQIGIREREIRSGYSGFVFLTGIAR